MTKKLKKRTSKRVKKTNDTTFSLLVRSRGYCEAAGVRIPCSPLNTLQCCHIKTRGYNALRCLEKNALCMCAAHHAYFHKNPDYFGLWIEQRWPGREAELYALNQKSVNKTWHLKDFLKIEEFLQKRLQSLPPVQPRD